MSDHLPTCPSWCSIEHDDWERQGPGGAFHSHTVGRIAARCHPDLGHKVSVWLYLSDPLSGFDPKPPEVTISCDCPDLNDSRGPGFPARDAVGLADVLPALRKSDPLAPLLREAAGLLTPPGTAG
jgi:hypothetical protein